MKILFYYYMGGGGGFSNIALLLRSLAEFHPEDSIEIVTSPWTPFDGFSDVPNVRIHRVRYTGIKEVDRFLIGVYYLARIAKEIKADIVWSMNLGPYVRIGLPSVLSVNNSYQLCPWEVSRHHPSNFLHVAVLRIFSRFSLWVSDGVVVQTRLMEDYLRGFWGAPRKVCLAAKAVVSKGPGNSDKLPVSLQDAIKTDGDTNVFTFLYVSNCLPHKNHRVLVSAFSELAKRNIKTRVILTVETREIVDALGAEAEQLIKRGYIVPVGWVPGPHLSALYSVADACLMPSLLESLSSAHIEAMRWGKPQITSDVIYSREVCGKAALYVKEDDPHAWAEEIWKLMGDAALRAELVSAGHERVKSFPATWEDTAEVIYRFLKATADSKRLSKHSTV